MPSGMPSSPATNFPSIEPTNSQSESPSNIPSTNPSIYHSSESNIESTASIDKIDEGRTTATRLTDSGDTDGSGFGDNTESLLGQTMIVTIVFFVCGCLLCCCGILIFIINQRLKEKLGNREKEIEIKKLETVAANPNVARIASLSAIKSNEIKMNVNNGDILAVQPHKGVNLQAELNDDLGTAHENIININGNKLPKERMAPIANTIGGEDSLAIDGDDNNDHDDIDVIYDDGAEGEGEGDSSGNVATVAEGEKI